MMKLNKRHKEALLCGLKWPDLPILAGYQTCDDLFGEGYLRKKRANIGYEFFITNKGLNLARQLTPLDPRDKLERWNRAIKPKA